MRGSKSRINCFEKVHEIETGLGKNSLGKPKTLVVQLVKGFGRGCLLSNYAVSRAREPCGCRCPNWESGL